MEPLVWSEGKYIESDINMGYSNAPASQEIDLYFKKKFINILKLGIDPRIFKNNLNILIIVL